MNEEITIDNIQEEFLKACHIGNIGFITYLLNHNFQYMINLTENDYEAIKLIELNSPELLDFVLTKRVKQEGRIQKGNYYVDANTYYCILSKETQQNSQLALNILVNGNEYLDLIPNELKTPDFLEKLAHSNYKQNIFDFDFIYDKKYEQFLITYISQGHTFSKKNKLSEDLIQDKDFILKISKYKCNLFPLVSHIYQNDKDIMTNIALNEENSFSHMSSNIRKEISNNKDIALKLLDLDPYNYEFITKEMQKDRDCIEKVLTKKPAIYEIFITELKNDKSLTYNLLRNYEIDVKFLSDLVKDDRNIAKLMTEKNGSNLEYFPLFKEDKELVEIALKTSKRLSLIPKNQRSDKIIEETVLQANIEENSFNLHYLTKEVKENRDFILQIIKNDKMFKEDLFALVNDYGNHKEDYEVVKSCVEKHPDLYGRFYFWKEDYEIIHIFISEMKKQTNGVFSSNVIPAKVKAEASMVKISIDKYVFNKTLEKRSQNWEKKETTQVKKTKI